MSKKTDDSIDRIFRQALTHYDTKFHEDDWLKMEKLLNEEAERKAAARSKRIKGTAYTLTGLTGLFIVVYFLATKNPSGTIANPSDSVTEMQATEALTENGNVKLENPSEGLLSQDKPDVSEPAVDEQKQLWDKAPDSSDKVSDLNDPFTTSPEERAGKTLSNDPKGNDIEPSPKGNNDKGWKGEIDHTDPSVKSRPIATEQDAADRSTYTRKMNDEDVKPGLDPSNESNPSLTPREEAENVEAVDDKHSRSDDNSGHTNLPATPRESGGNTLASQETIDQQSGSANGTSAESLNANQSNSVTVTPDSSKISQLSSKTIQGDSTQLAEDTSNKPGIKPKGRWSVAFVIAPEFSTTSLSSYSSPGDSYGLRIGYQLSNRFSINTGFIRSHKKYEGYGDDYKPRNPAYWQIRTNGVVPEEIYSKCLVYELPLGVQFDALQTLKSRVFVSTSISSYFMINQAYDYTFPTPNPGADTGWRSRGSESYWFSVGMVSAGYERYITQSFAIGFEPYLKISLSEIGWPNIKLYSTGAYVTLRYRFVSRRNF